MILNFLFSIPPETVALGVHLGQATLVALLADLGQVRSQFCVWDKDLKYLEVDIATSEAVPVTILVHHLGLDHGNSVLLELWFCKQASLNDDVRKVEGD